MENNNYVKPNIVFILADDLGPWAMGCAGNKEILTPNLDKLAAGGMRFENFFCTSPVCSPARASILTGKIPSCHGVHDWIREGNYGDNAIEYLKGQQAYTDILAENGYSCGIAGKWHLGNGEKLQNSFSHWCVLAYAPGSGYYNNVSMMRGNKLVYEKEYITDVITDDAICFIEESSKEDSPFYLSVHYTAPHSPWLNCHPEEYVEMYSDCSFESCPQNLDHPWGESRLTAEVKKDPYGCLRGYFAAVTAMDHNIGRLVEKLDKLGLRENTLICFMSDNGFSCGQHGFWGKGNGTFPLNLYDNSVKVPAIFNHQGVIPPGISCKKLLNQYDIFPTILEYAGICNKTNGKLPGMSFTELLKGRNKKAHETVVVFSEYGPVRMIRTDEWKYVHRSSGVSCELYNIKNDPQENENLITEAKRKNIVNELNAGLYDWFVEYTEPEYDGRHCGVSGYGQLNMAGRPKNGAKSFYQFGE